MKPDQAWLRGDPLEDHIVRRMARILGEHSASAKALAEATQRRDQGEAIEFRLLDGVIIVGSSQATPAEGREDLKP